MIQKILQREGQAEADLTQVQQQQQSPLNAPGNWRFFLSHAQATGGDQAQAISLRLSGMGMDVWYDHRMADRSTEAMEEGVANAQTFVRPSLPCDQPITRTLPGSISLSPPLPSLHIAPPISPNMI